MQNELNPKCVRMSLSNGLNFFERVSWRIGRCDDTLTSIKHLSRFPFTSLSLSSFLKSHTHTLTHIYTRTIFQTFCHVFNSFNVKRKKKLTLNCFLKNTASTDILSKTDMTQNMVKKFRCFSKLITLFNN